MAAGSIILDLLMRTGSFSTDTDRAAKDLAKLKKEAYATGKAMGDSVKNVAAALGVGLSVAAFTSMIKSSIDAADHLNDLSKTTGITVEVLGGIGLAARQSGLDLDSVAAGTGKLNKSLAEAASGNDKAGEAFKKLGIDVKDSIGQTKSADTVLIELADKFESFADGPEKAALAIRLFGKAGVDMIPLLNDGGAALRANIEYFKRYSGVSTETAQKADQFNDTLTKLSLLSGAFGNAVAAELLTPLQAIADAFLKAKEQGSGFHGVASAIATAFKGTAEVVGFFALTLEATGDKIGAFIARIQVLADAADRARAKSGALDLFGSGSLFGELSDALPKLKAIDDESRAHLERTRKSFQDFRTALAGGDQSAASFESGFTPTTPKKPPAPRLPGGGEDGELKKRLEGEIKLEQEFGRQRAEAFKFAEKFLDGVFADGLISLQDYFAAQKNLRDAALADQLATIDKQIAADQKALPKTKGTDRVDLENKIAEAVAKRSGAVLKAGQDDIVATQQEAREVKALRDSYDDLQTKVLDLKGDTSGAAAIRNAKDVAAARKLITSAKGDSALGDQYADLLTKTTQLSKVQQDYNLLLEDSRTVEERILLDAQAGGETELDTLRKVGAARSLSLEQLGVLADKAHELAITLGTPDAIRFADQLANAFKKASLEVDPLLTKLRDASHEAAGAITSGFEDAILSGKGLRETIQGIGADLTRIVFKKLVTEPLTKSIENALGGTGSDGGILGKIFGIGGKAAASAKTGGAAAASSTSPGSAAAATPTALTTGDFTRTDHDTSAVAMPPTTAAAQSSIDQSLAATTTGFATLQSQGIEPTITALQRFQSALQNTPSTTTGSASSPVGEPSASGAQAFAVRPAGPSPEQAALNQASADTTQGFTLLDSQGIEPSIASLQRFQAALGATPSVPTPAPLDGGVGAGAGAPTVGLTTGDFTRTDHDLSNLTSEQQSMADLFKDAGTATSTTAQSTAALGKATDTTAATILRLAQSAAQGNSALSLLPSIIQLIQASMAVSSGSGSSGGGGGLIGSIVGLFTGGGGTGSVTGAFSQTSIGGSGFGSGFAYGNNDLGAFLHSGGVVGEDLPKTPGAHKSRTGVEVPPTLRPNERRAILNVGDEVITRDDPRNVANQGMRLVEAFDGKASDLKGLVVGGDTPQATAAKMTAGIKMPGPLKPNERRTVLEIGEEVLPKDDPRHRDNAGSAMLSEKKYHDGGVVGRAVSNVYRNGAPPAAWAAAPTLRDERAATRPIQINQTFPPGTTRATTDQAAASAGAAVRKANSRIR